MTHCGIWVVDLEALAHGLNAVHRPLGLDLHLVGLLINERHAAAAAIQINCLQFLQDMSRILKAY